jgi:hypothetical protein
LILVLEVASPTARKSEKVSSQILAYSKARYSKSKVMAEAGDTAVRECVWGFAVDAGKAMDLGYNTLDELWDSIF